MTIETKELIISNELKRNSKYKDDAFELGILTIDVSNIFDKDGNQFYKNILIG